MEQRHDSVLVKEVMQALRVNQGDTVVDATLGGAGHFTSILAALGADGVLVGIDADSAAVERARAAYALDRRIERPVAHLINDNFRNLSRILERLGIGSVNAVLFDLGWSGYQIASPRGFSFQHDEPLLMTYGEGGQGSYGTAADLVNSLSEDELSKLISAYSDERFARQIARSIVNIRKGERILTTGALVRAVEAGVPRWYRQGRIHPATKTFQALRIAINDELGALSDGITSALAALTPGGRLAVISFHSIEDRLVKNMLHDAAEEGKGSVVTKKPIVPARSEVLENRRARSAKLRVFERALTKISSEAIGSNATFSYV